ncbi:hypothetical protein BDZ89DRAFT_507958 [Hymenopellis radicata]|nr:hypothetical protein BDZ89DRAFT_507958 [Hymenopellis radicata]
MDPCSLVRRSISVTGILDRQFGSMFMLAGIKFHTRRYGTSKSAMEGAQCTLNGINVLTEIHLMNSNGSLGCRLQATTIRFPAGYSLPLAPTTFAAATKRTGKAIPADPEKRTPPVLISTIIYTFFSKTTALPAFCPFSAYPQREQKNCGVYTGTCRRGSVFYILRGSGRRRNALAAAPPPIPGGGRLSSARPFVVGLWA